MCPIDAAQWGWVLLALSALALVWQAWRYTHGSAAARLALVGWAAWIGAIAWTLATSAGEGPAARVGVFTGTWLLLLAFTIWVVHRDWRAATQARRAAEEAIDRHMQAELQRVFNALQDQSEQSSSRHPRVVRDGDQAPGAR